jgi:carbamoyl-phosphate synthase large subunit
MKSVGEATAIDRTFKENLQSCLRSLEIGRSGLGGDGKRWRSARKFLVQIKEIVDFEEELAGSRN